MQILLFNDTILIQLDTQLVDNINKQVIKQIKAEAGFQC